MVSREVPRVVSRKVPGIRGNVSWVVGEEGIRGWWVGWYQWLVGVGRYQKGCRSGIRGASRYERYQEVVGGGAESSKK